MTDAAEPARSLPSAGRVLVLVLAIVAAWVVSGVVFGYAGVIIPALIAVAVAFAGIITLSRG